MLLKKFLLLVVGEKDGPLAGCVPLLKNYNFSVAQVSSVEHALELLESTALLSMVAVEDGIGDAQGWEFLKRAREKQPDLPILWATDKEGAPPSEDIAPDAVLRLPVESDEFDRQATTLLRQHFYSEELVQRLQKCVTDVLSESFKTQIDGHEPFLKGTRALGGDVSSMIYFAGHGVSGHIIVSGMLEHIQTLRGRILPEAKRATFEQAADLVGELCNLILGKFKSFFETRELAFDIGTPVLLHGANIVLRRVAGSPSLMLPFEEEAGTLYVEFCFDRLDSEPKSEDAESSLMASGDLVFL